MAHISEAPRAVADISGLGSAPGVASTARIERLEELLRQTESRVAWIQDICTALGAYERQDELLTFVMERITLIMDAERATLFLLDDDGQHIWSRVVSDRSTTEMRLRLGEGIAGWVAQSGKSINVKDAYQDARFDRRFDEETGFTTRSVLCQPMRNRDGNTIGVVQVLNKRAGYFSVDDESLLSAITNTAAIVIENQQLYLDAMDRALELSAIRRQLEERIHRLDTLHEIHQRIAGVERLEDVIETVAVALAEAISSYGCAITILDGMDRHEWVFARASRKAPFLPGSRTWSRRIREDVLTRGRSIIDNANCDAPGSAAVTGGMPAITKRPVASVAAVPLIVEGSTIGCVELVNRCPDTAGEDSRGYSAEDQKLIELVAGEISASVAMSLERHRRERQGRLSAIGQMLSGVMHDMRTPLTVANGYLQLMARSGDEAARSRYAEAIGQQFAHLNHMTRELLAYARGETEIFIRNVHLHVLIEEFEELLGHEFADRGVKVEVTASYRGDARIDDGKLKRVIFNLARNSRDAMPQGGEFRVDFARDGDMLVVAVADTGHGIPEAAQSRIFEAFVTSGKSGGTGLGLAIVKKLVDEHGGTISFDSREGEGTRFEIRLPIAAE